ncbi:hypothetical protein HN011_004794 [Eciton burchellii]|nr:hypothetical protein HN011_004794 [Eciton burchellii]
MHSVVLDATSYILLLSSFVTFLILLWLRYKHQKKKSPFYILSISDVLSAALTAIILLINHIEPEMKINYNSQNSVGKHTFNRTWTAENQSQQQFLPFLQIHDLSDAIDNTDLNVTLTCDMKDILMQYGMLLATLANAFISLLTFVVQCNLSAACLRQRYARIIESSTNDARLASKDMQVTCRGRRTMEDEHKSMSQRQDNIATTKRSNNIDKFLQRIAKISKFQMMNEDDEKSAGYLVILHWLIPFLVVGILYFAEYDDTNIARHAEDSECIFENNFPMNDLYISLNVKNNPETINSVTQATLENNYLLHQELLNKSKANNVEINQIVLKVQDIVKTILNCSHDTAENVETRDNSSESRNTTKYVIANDTIIYRENDTNINTIIQILYDTSMDYNNASEGEKDISAIGSLNNASQISVQSKNESYQQATQMYFTSKEENTSRWITNIPIIQNVPFVSDNEIYIDIIKRIQAANVHNNATKNRYDPHDNGKTERNLRISAKEKPYSSRHLSFNETDHFNQYINSMIKRDSQSNISSNKKINVVNVNKLPSEVPVRLSMNDRKIGHGSLTQQFDISQEPSSTQDNETSGEATDECHESCVKIQNQDIFKIDCMVRIFNTVRLLLILCVLLWSPMFLETLLRAFSCIRAPQWWNNITFSSAISFSIIRNILNINIIKIQEACSNVGAKENRVYPIK